jgi:3-hydroxy acid dehydrogenase / malonic semialdehyde reductase
MNRIICITGATSGIGLACAEKFAASGDHLILTGRRADRLQAITDRLIAAFGIRILPLVFDVRDRNAVFDQLNQLPEDWSAVDILINNAGLALGRDYFEEADLDDWENMLQTNVNGIIYTTRALLPFMIARHTGHIINIGSIAGKEVYEKGNMYCASKQAVNGLSQAMRIDLLRHGIKVTTINPGAVETEFSSIRFKGDAAKAAAVYSGYKPLTAADVADTIWYCVNLPPHVCINDVIMTCTRQASSFYLQKD